MNHERTRAVALGLLLLLLMPPTLSAQSAERSETPAEQKSEAVSPQGAADSDPIQVVLFNVRNEYYDLKGGNWTNATILRGDRAFLKKTRFGGKLGILTRTDVPIQTSEVGSSVHSGLGDFYGQAIIAPFLTPRFALFVGTGMVLPTATHDTLGGGKWTVAPAVGPVLFFGGHRGFAFIKFQEYYSFAGDADRPDKNYLLITPTMVLNLWHGWWLLLQEESRIDFENSSEVWYKAGVQLGHMFSKKIGLWVQPEIFWGETRPGDYGVKASFVWNR